MGYIVDADWVIKALTGSPSMKTTLRHLMPQGIFISLITVGEIYEGAFRTSNPQAHLDGFRVFLQPFRTLGLSVPIMERFAEIRAFLRRRGELISDFDILLSATALDYDLTVLTYNVRHLRRIPELKIYRPDMG